MQPSYDEVFTYSNLVKSAEECIKGVMWKQSVQSFESQLYIWCSKLHRQLSQRQYRSKGFTDFYIHERGKTRHIQSVHISERVVQKTLTQYALKPILEPSLIYDNGASLKGKGQDFAVKRFREHLRWHYARFELQGGILIGDFHNFFGSIDHGILLKQLRDKIKDDDIFELTKYFITCFDGDKGLGLGSEISQICAIFYPNQIDHIVKEQYGIHGYARYMDDFYAISEDESKLYAVLDAITKAASELGLRLNHKRTNVYRFADIPISQHPNIPTSTYLKCKTRLEENGRISMRMVSDNVKRRRSWLRKQKVLLDAGLIDNEYMLKSMLVWIGYALKRKSSYQTVQNTIQYLTKILKEE